MYGRGLGVKILVFGTLLLLGAFKRFWLHPRIDAPRAAGDDRPQASLSTTCPRSRGGSARPGHGRCQSWRLLELSHPAVPTFCAEVAVRHCPLPRFSYVLPLAVAVPIRHCWAVEPSQALRTAGVPGPFAVRQPPADPLTSRKAPADPAAYVQV
jgi:hypothetical protein